MSIKVILSPNAANKVNILCLAGLSPPEKRPKTIKNNIQIAKNISGAAKKNLEMFNEYAIATNNIESIVTFIKNNWDEPHKLKKYVEEHHSELDNFARSIKITNKLKNKTKKNIKLNYKKKHTK